MADPVAAATHYDTSQLTQIGIQNLDKVQINTQKAVAKLEADRLAGKDVIESVSLNDNQVDELVEFLKALTDPCTKDRSCMSKWIVDPVIDADPNGDQLNAVDANSNPL
jgi:cytochrome c peroxidase